MAESPERAHEKQRAHLGDNKRVEIVMPTMTFLTVAYPVVFFWYESGRMA